jgi:peptide/nickel transport system substrate-binding protein
MTPSVLRTLAALALLAAACAPATPAAPTAGGPAATTSPAGDRLAARTLKKVTIALGADARTLLPNAVVDWTTDVQITHLFDRVMNYDPARNYEVGPWLADLKNLDELTWELKIVRPGITFHNGEPVDAESIKAGLDFARDPANKSHYLERYKPIVEVAVVDPLTLRLKTSEPFPILPQRMTGLYPVPPRYLKEKGAEFAANNPVGSGPFKFKEWMRDERLVLERNPDYWRGPVQVETVEFRYIPEFSARLSALLAGEVDIVKDVPVDAIERVAGSGRARVEEIPSSRINYVALVNNREGSIMRDRRVRQAVNHAVNVDGLIAGVFRGHATRMAGPLSRMNPEANQALTPYPYDPDRAKALLREAGVDLDNTRVVLDAPQGRYPMDKEAAQAIAAQLGQVGLRVQVQYNEWGTHLDKIVNRATGDMFYLGWGPALDAQGTLEFLFVGQSTYSGFGDPAIEEKVAAAARTVDPQTRRQVWNEVQRMAYDEAAWLFLWQQHDLYGVANTVDWKPRPDEFLWMGEAKGK